MEWDPSRLESSGQKHPPHRSAQGFSFYPTQVTARELSSRLDLQTEMTGMAQEDSEFQVMTARTEQSSCFEPRFEHEEAA